MNIQNYVYTPGVNLHDSPHCKHCQFIWLRRVN